MIHLTEEKQEDLNDLLMHEGMSALFLLMDELAKPTINRILTYNVDGNEDKIVYEKLRYDGMIQMKNLLVAYRNQALKAKGEQDVRPKSKPRTK